MEIIKKILEWPVIVQGALGSFLFWLAYSISKQSFTLVSSVYGKYSKDFRVTHLLLERVQRTANTIQENTKASYLATCCYAALFYGMKGLIFITLGLIASQIFEPLHVIGYIIALYYLFRAMKSVELVVNDKVNDSERILEIEKEVKKLTS